LFPNGITGSGFYVNTSKNTYLVTARHVVFNKDCTDRVGDSVQALSYSKNPSEQEKAVLTIDLATLQSSGEIRCQPAHDVVVIRVASATAEHQITMLNAVKVTSVPKSGILGVGLDTIIRFDQALEANDIFIFGYPTSLGLKEVPQIDYDRPLLRKGIIAGKNHAQRLLILDCPVYPGNSGGAVLQVSRQNLASTFMIVGVVSQFVPSVETWVNLNVGYKNSTVYNSGYSVATPMDFVLDLIAAAEAGAT